MTALSAALAEARTGLRLRRRGALLTATGIALAGAMLSAAVVVGVGLGGGFNRAAKAADLPDIIVRFNPESAGLVDQRIKSLPDIASYSTRLELTNTRIAAGGRHRNDAVAEVMSGTGRPGYAVVAGHNLSPRRPQVLVELGFAQAWHLHLGSTLDVGGLGPQRVVGFAEAPDNVGYPLAKPRYYVSLPAVLARFGQTPSPSHQVSLAEIWLRNPAYLNEVLVQARATSFGLHDIQFATRSGVKVLLDQAAGIVIDLLVALSIIALVTASAMLAASARAEVQRRLSAIGVRRAVGASQGHIALAQGFEAMLIAVPAAALGVLAGVLATYGADDRLLTMLNEPPPGAALALPLAAGFLAAVAIPVLGAAWPAWRAAGRSPVGLLRGGELETRGGGRGAGGRGGRAPRGGLAVLGVRLVAARRVRLAATVVTLGLSAGFVLLMLALASALSSLETDPSALGKRYQVTATMPLSTLRRARRIPGIAAIAPRYEVEAADSYYLGETIDVIAYPGNHTVFEDPPLVSGHRLRGDGQAEVGVGLADALGLSPGSTLAIALSSGDELRFRVAGLVSSLDHDGRVAYIPARALLAADPSAPYQVAVVLRSLADYGLVTAALSKLGAQFAATSGATARGVPLVNTLRTILIAIAVVDGLVCLYALIQASTLTVQERRRTVAVLRACGAGPGAVRRLLLGATAALLVPAAAFGIVLEKYVFGPALSHLAVNYATLVLDPTTAEILVTLAGLALAGVIATVWVARQASRESVVSGLGAR
jgi:ABC-type antimicrobial peptide transport system permease subunit